MNRNSRSAKDDVGPVHAEEIDGMLRANDDYLEQEAALKSDSGQTVGKKLIVSTMKDEAPYLLEWIAYHRAIGFTDFLIYTNDCSDGTDLLLDRLQQNKIVTHVRNVVLKRGPHKSALKYAQSHQSYASAQWVYVCDVDEFLNVKIGNGHVDDLIAHSPDAEVIPVAWRLFSNAGQSSLFPGECMKVFTDAEPAVSSEDEEGRFVKSLFRPSLKVRRLGLHAPVFDEADENDVVWCAPWLQSDPESDPRRPNDNFGYEIAQVNHYAVRSIDAFLIKRNRGRANHVNERIGKKYWMRWCRGGETDLSIQRHLDAMSREYQKLVSDPIVAHLERGARVYQEQQLGRLLKRDEYLALRQELIEISATPSAAEIPVAPMPSRSSLATPEEANQIIGVILEENDRNRAPNRRALRRQMLDEVMPKGGRCAEIGVWQGDFSAEILNITQPRELVLIDPWDLLAEKTEEHTHAQHASAQKMQSKYDHVTRTLGRLPNCIVRKGFSADVLETYPDGYFDWVYIDGNHMYDFVLEDILISARKVRSGGLIAGDDLFWKKDGRMHVREAVREAMRQLGDRAKQTRRGAQFLIHLS
ncbi:glycosyltransferase family 2 protein [Ruegeria sp. R13_0]|uniref:glycosyltransferase family 2 protein n=1 Tax=Ruegeria sp. R13_0 TaxID=2821099 RepID=UPI001ADCD296|nr:glycosyltransferase family 2 protein [Ruegeria sp. R13_0]MBO9436316.1 glycosyltransferase family 2 protein [Ruegeria sp. R13_0]